MGKLGSIQMKDRIARQDHYEPSGQLHSAVADLDFEIPQVLGLFSPVCLHTSCSEILVANSHEKLIYRRNDESDLDR